MCTRPLYLRCTCQTAPQTLCHTTVQTLSDTPYPLLMNLHPDRTRCTTESVAAGRANKTLCIAPSLILVTLA